MLAAVVESAQTRKKGGEWHTSHAHDCRLVCLSHAGQTQREGGVGCSAAVSSLLCVLAKFGALLEEGFAEKQQLWPEWVHWYLGGRRMEDSELVHRATGKRLRAAGVAHINALEDMSIAFACTASEERFSGEYIFSTYVPTNSMVRIETSEGVIEALLSCGHFMGSARSCLRKPTRDPSLLGSRTRSTSLESCVPSDWTAKQRDISLVAVADDVFRKLVCDGRDGAEGTFSAG